MDWSEITVDNRHYKTVLLERTLKALEPWQSADIPSEASDIAVLHHLAKRLGWTIKTRYNGYGMAILTRLPDKPTRAIELSANIAWTGGDSDAAIYRGLPSRLDPMFDNGTLMDDNHTVTQVVRQVMRHVGDNLVYRYRITEISPPIRGRVQPPTLFCHTWDEVCMIIGLSRLRWKTVLQDELAGMAVGEALIIPNNNSIAHFISLQAYLHKWMLRQRQIDAVKRIVWLLAKPSI